MRCRCRYVVVRDYGPWKQGWRLVWDMVDDRVSIIAKTDRRHVGTWGPDRVPLLMRALYLDGAVQATHVAPIVERVSHEQMRNSHDYEGDRLRSA